MADIYANDLPVDSTPDATARALLVDAAGTLLIQGPTETERAAQFATASQGIVTFASAAARDTYLVGVLAEGMHCYLSDTNTRAYYNGSAWIASTPWTQYTPVLATWSLGNATHSCWYKVDGDVVHLAEWIRLGSTSTMVGAPQWELPVAHGETSALLRLQGEASVSGSSTIHPIYWRTQSSTITVGLCVNAAGTYTILNPMSATVPITFAENHYITRRGTYRAL